MNYPPVLLKFSVTIPNTQIAATDYIQIFSNNGSGDVNTSSPLSPKIAGVADGSGNFVFNWQFRVIEPALWKFIFTAFDQCGNAGTSSAVYAEDLTGMVPAAAPDLEFVGYDAGTKELTLSI